MLLLHDQVICTAFLQLLLLSSLFVRVAPSFRSLHALLKKEMIVIVVYKM